MFRLCTLFCLWACAVAGIGGGEARGDDVWPAFRGPRGDGITDSRGLPLKWSATENVVWRVPTGGRGFSSPVIWGKQVWMTTATEDGKELSILCVDRESGKIIHDRRIFEVANPLEKHKFNTYSSPTPAIEEGRIYASWGSAGIACLDTATCEVLWARRDLECNHYRGAGSSPVIHENLLIQTYDGFDYQYTIAVDKRSGETVWKTDRPVDFGTDNGDIKKAYATPLVIQVGDRTEVISPASKGAFGYDVMTGEEIWRITYEGFSCASRPFFDQKTGLVYFSSGFSKAEYLAVDPRGTGDITKTHVRWIDTNRMPSKPSGVTVDGRVFVISDDGIASCMEGESGKQVWRTRIGGNHTSSMLYGDGKIYVSDESGKTTVFAAEGEYRMLAENQLDSGIYASFAVSGKSLFIRTDKFLYRIEEGAAGK